MLFGSVIDGEMRLSLWGEIAHKCWRDLPDHFPNADVDAFVVMPNHVHGIVVITKNIDKSDVGARHAVPLPTPRRFGTSIPGSLSTIIGAYKSAVTKRINRLRETPNEPVWQRNYYETIIRNEPMLNAIRQYIEANPANWQFDLENIHPF